MGSRERMAQFSAVMLEKSNQTVHSPAMSRVLDLLDTDSYVSLDSLVTSEPAVAGVERPSTPGDGVFTGYGTIDNRLVYLAAQDFSILGGSIGQRHAAKIAKVIRLAQRAGVPFIGLYETGGVRIDEGLSALEAVSDVLAALQAASGDIPLIAAVYGPCVGSAALFAGLSDLTLMSKEQGVLTLNGPGVIAAVENKPVKATDLGGYAVHGSKTGLAALSGADDQAVTRLIRKVLAYLPDTSEGFFSDPLSQDDPNRCEAALDTLAEQLDAAVDVRTVAQLIVDQQSLLELHADFAPEWMTSLAHLDGRSVGLMGLSGSRLTVAMTEKATRFTAFCDRMNLPVITLLDCAGFAVSSDEESQGLTLAAARLFAVNQSASIPRLTVVMGQAIGPAYTVLASRGAGTDAILAWPTAELAPTTADTAAHILKRSEIAAAADPISARTELTKLYADSVSSPFTAAAQGLVDEIIAPSATRPRLISALQTLA